MPTINREPTRPKGITVEREYSPNPERIASALAIMLESLEARRLSAASEAQGGGGDDKNG
jgi:hypothetical protein